MGATDITEAARQGRSDSLVASPFPLLAAGFWLVPSVSSGSNQGKGVAAMGAIDIQNQQGKGVVIPLL